MRKTTLVATSLLLLSACGESPAEKVQTLLQQGQTNDALRLINDTLKEDPNNAYLRAVSAKLLTDACVRDNCAAESDEDLAAIRKRLQGLPARVTITEGATYDVYGEVLKSARRLISQHNNVDGYLKFTREALPTEAPQDMFLTELRELVIGSVVNGDMATTTKLLDMLVEGTAEGTTTPLSLEVRYLQALLRGDTVVLTQLAPTMLETIKTQPTVASDMLRILPHLLVLEARRAADADPRAAFVRLAKAPFMVLQLPDLNTPENIGKLAADLERLSKDAAFVARLGEGTTAVEGIQDNAEFTRLMVLKAGLVLEPGNAPRWKAFFQPALDNASAKASLRFLYDDIELSGMAPEVIIENNNLILGRMRQMLDAGENIVPVLREIIYRGDAQQLAFAEQTAQMLTGALDNALQQKDPTQILVYVGYDRKIANGREEAITTMMTEAIKQQWERNEFGPIAEWAGFLTNTLKVAYSMDVQISDLLSEYLNSQEVQDAVTGMHPRQLLQTAEEAALDLGPKLAFAEDHFKDRPDIIQAKLKTMALNAPGTYGTPLTLLRLKDHFDMPDWQEQFTTALKVSINKDKDTPATDLATVGEQLVKMWSPGIVYNFVINEVFSRVNKLEDLREVWKVASPEFRQNTESLRPQLAALMQAIDAYEADDLVTAASKFAVLSDQSYLAAAHKYMDAFSDLIKPFLGTYAMSNGADSTVGMLRIDQGRELLTANLTFTNAVGMLEKREEFVINRGDVVNLQVVGKFNPKTRTITVEAAAREAGVDGIGFERLVGDLKEIQLHSDGKLVLTTATETSEMQRVAEVGARLPLPQGRFGITAQVTPHDANSDHVLPIGSILEFTTEDRPGQQTISDGAGGSKEVTAYPINGTVMHPSQRSPITLSGYYLPDTGVVAMTFSYPMNEGRTMLDADLRCHVLGANIICAGQNRHWSRQRFTHIVRGMKAKIEQQ